MKAASVVIALDNDTHPDSAPCNRFVALNDPCPRPSELFVKMEGRACMWLRADGRWVSGWSPNGLHFSQQYGPLRSWWIRQAVKRWVGRRTADQPKGPKP